MTKKRERERRKEKEEDVDAAIAVSFFKGEIEILSFYLFPKTKVVTFFICLHFFFCFCFFPFIINGLCSTIMQINLLFFQIVLLNRMSYGRQLTHIFSLLTSNNPGQGRKLMKFDETRLFYPIPVE